MALNEITVWKSILSPFWFCLELVLFSRRFSLRLFDFKMTHRNIVRNAVSGISCYKSSRSAGPRLSNNTTLKQRRYYGQPSYAFTPSNIPLISTTIGGLLEQAAEYDGDRTALVVCSQGIRKTYREFNDDVDKLAAALISLGLSKGDRIGMWGPSSYEWVLTQFATAKNGMILTTINPAYQAKELEYCLNKVKCSAIISNAKYKTQDFYEIINQVSPDLSKSISPNLKLKRLPDLKRLILCDGKSQPGALDFNEVFQSAGSTDFENLEKVKKTVQFDDAVNIQFTSGTTGSPKGATLTHFTISNNAKLMGYRFGYHHYNPVICVQVPLYHSFGCVAGTLCSTIFRGTCVIPSPGFSSEASLKAIQDEKCNMFYGTPTMYIDVISNDKFEKYDISSLKNGAMGGANCPVELIKKSKDKLRLTDIFIAYGATETSPVCTLTVAEDPEEKKTTSVGRPLDYIEVKVVDDHNHVVDVNTTGEVCLRGHATFLGYWDDEEKTKEALKSDKWYYSGDLGKMDEDGFLYIVGRKKEMVIRGGENIYTREIEEFLLTHPAIADAHVIGVPDTKFGEELCVWISLNSGANMEVDDLKAFCKGKISHFKIPRYVIFTEWFPQTVTGKVQKFRMKEESIKRLKLNDQ